LSQVEEETVLCIADNGAGFDAEGIEMGIGLHSMQERLSQAGGKLQVSSQKDSGTQITATLRRA
jgi:signal transduction histidine kinase